MFRLPGCLRQWRAECTNRSSALVRGPSRSAGVHRAFASDLGATALGSGGTCQPGENGGMTSLDFPGKKALLLLIHPSTWPFCLFDLVSFSSFLTLATLDG